VPQPSTDPNMQKGGQWPHSSTVNAVNPVMPYTSMAPLASTGQSGQPIFSQPQDLSLMEANSLLASPATRLAHLKMD
jgi:hypothetical protein